MNNPSKCSKPCFNLNCVSTPASRIAYNLAVPIYKHGRLSRTMSANGIQLILDSQPMIQIPNEVELHIINLACVQQMTHVLLRIYFIALITIYSNLHSESRRGWMCLGTLSMRKLVFILKNISSTWSS